MPWDNIPLNYLIMSEDTGHTWHWELLYTLANSTADLEQGGFTDRKACIDSAWSDYNYKRDNPDWNVS